MTAALPPPDLVLRSLFEYCRSRDWAGYDPYDALNSRLLPAIPGATSRLPQLMLTQLFKRSSIDLRGLFRVPPTQNPKAIALFLRAAIALEGRGIVDVTGLRARLIELLRQLRSPGMDHWCWGYSFPWQTRTVCVPRHSPNLVCTTFVADALLDAWDREHDPRLLEMANSACEYIANELYFEAPPDIASFNYPRAGLSSTVHNANLLAAALLLRTHRLVPNALHEQRALAAARFSASRQRADGSWPYGESPTQQWIDNFHTAYNLQGLKVIDRVRGTPEFAGHVARGYDYWRTTFIRDDGVARYFHDRTYPIDIHCVAQSLLTLTDFADVDPTASAAANRVYRWAVENMWDRRGYFYYRVLPMFRNRISYMRWSQAWMLLALATHATAAPHR